MNICLVANELLGAGKNGGIGTATSHLALFLAREDHDVSIIYYGPHPLDYQHAWIIRLQGAGISLTHVDGRQAEIHPEWLRESSVLFDYLRHTEFDLVLFQDWDGPGYASVVARRAGLAFDRTRLGIVAHGPTAWLIEANRTPVRRQTTLAALEMERVAFSEADLVVCPSRHMLNWLQSNNHVLAADAVVLPLYLWSDPEGDEEFRRRTPLAHVRTFAFYGRLEERKGIDLFLHAITSDRLAFEDFRVVFLGRSASRSPGEVIAFVQDRRPWLVPRLSFESDLDSDQAQRFLVEHDCLAIVPSLVDNAPCVISECLRRNIPFLSTRTGGIPELVNADDAAHVLVPPEPGALAACMASLLGGPMAPIRAALDEQSVAGQWRDWLAAHPRLPARSTRSDAVAAPGLRLADPPSLALILTHYERPHLVMQTLESLAAQTMTGFELILVDDGSRSEPALCRLAEIEQRPWPFKLTVLRGQNRYLGAARNAGIRASSAQRLIFMDDDNVAFPPMVESFDRAMTCTGADIVTCQMMLFKDPHDGPSLGLLDGGERWAYTSGPTELGLSINCFGDATGIYRRSVFDRIGFFHEWHGVGHEDWHLHVRAALAGLKTTSLPVPLYWYRMTTSGMLGTTDRYANHKIIWDLYAGALPPGLARLVDLSVCNDLGNERL